MMKHVKHNIDNVQVKNQNTSLYTNHDSFYLTSTVKHTYSEQDYNEFMLAAKLFSFLVVLQHILNLKVIMNYVYIQSKLTSL